MPPVPSSSGPPPPPSLVVIGIGANLGDPEGQLRQAVQSLGQRFGPLRVSSLYASAPIGPDQPDFLNAAALLEVREPLLEILELSRGIEHEQGRVRNLRWGPRVIDLDLLWSSDLTSSTSELTVPHPELTKRAFALLPLLEICPEASVPGTGQPYRSFLPDVHSQRISVVRGPEWWRTPETTRVP